MSLIHAVGMLLLFFTLLALELFIPSGGLLGIAAGAALIAAIVIGFLHSLVAGASILVGSAVLVPLLISAGLRIWPRTPMGRRMLTLDPEADVAREAALRLEREAIIGKIGVAKTDMLPSGLVEIEGVRMDAVSVGMVIDRGQVVEVVSVTSGKIRVRPVEAGRNREETPRVPETLETPIESLGLEDWK
jgi:membrane-bound ClpP family serine protease